MTHIKPEQNTIMDYYWRLERAKELYSINQDLLNSGF